MSRPDLTNKKPIMSVEVDLFQVRSLVDGRMPESFAESKSASSSVIKEFVQLFEELGESADEKDKVFLEQIKTAKRCTKVYWGCGSCRLLGHEGGWVQYFCDGGGSGSEPDRERCEIC